MITIGNIRMKYNKLMDLQRYSASIEKKKSDKRMN